MPETLHNIWIVAKREFAAYFATPIATVFLVIFVALTGAFAFYVGGFFERGQAELSRLLPLSPLALSACWCRPSACGCGRRSARAAPSSC